jgi:hypothetical protein
VVDLGCPSLVAGKLPADASLSYLQGFFSSLSSVTVIFFGTLMSVKTLPKDVTACFFAVAEGGQTQRSIFVVLEAVRFLSAGYVNEM